MTDNMREEFEKCWRECGNCEEDDIYNTNEYEVFKFAWQASRAALCVDHPYSWYQDNEGYIMYRDDDVKSSLDDAGVKYNEH